MVKVASKFAVDTIRTIFFCNFLFFCTKSKKYLIFFCDGSG